MFNFFEKNSQNRTMISAQERISKIADQWFISTDEGALFVLFCTHSLEENSRMQCAFRSGKGKIQFNPEMVNLMSTPALKDALTAEIIRISLMHPYERQPFGCPKQALKAGSDMVISPAYQLKYIDMAEPSQFNLPDNQNFEWYVNAMSEKIKEVMSQIDSKGDKKQMPDGQTEPGDSSNGDKGKGEEVVQVSSQMAAVLSAPDDYTALWEDDEVTRNEVKEKIEEIESSIGWGNFPQALVHAIRIAANGTIDYRKVMRAFSTSIISSKRNLTRMRPNRRFGFEAMGSKHEMASRLLVATDVSGSVGDKDFARFFHIITQFFLYGVEAVDVIQFDVEVSKEVMSLKDAAKVKHMKTVNRLACGGTNFQCVFDYLKQHSNYDGLIIFTDGWAQAPTLNFKPKAKILWVVDNEQNYNEHKNWMKETGRACFIV